MAELKDNNLAERPVKRRSGTAAAAECGLLAALGLVFSWIEFLLPVLPAIPGIKLGLANIVVVIALYREGPVMAFTVNLVRVLLAGLLFGSGFSTVYALSGAVVSFLIMLLLKKLNIFSIPGVSMAGGVFHNGAQLCLAALITSTPKVFYYFPVLLFAGIITGIINGVLSVLVLRKLR